MEDAINIQRKRIADAFEQHFRHYGFKKTTVDEVALDLGVSKKTIYKCFRSKDDIFYYIISNKAKERRLMIEKKILHLDTAWEKMETMIRINFTEFRKIHKKKPTGINDRFQSEIASAAFGEMFISLIWDIIEEGIVHYHQIMDIPRSISDMVHRTPKERTIDHGQ